MSIFGRFKNVVFNFINKRVSCLRIMSKAIFSSSQSFKTNPLVKHILFLGFKSKLSIVDNNNVTEDQRCCGHASKNENSYMAHFHINLLSKVEFIVYCLPSQYRRKLQIIISNKVSLVGTIFQKISQTIFLNQIYFISYIEECLTYTKWLLRLI